MTHTQDACQRMSVLKATGSDSRDVWEWRNDEVTRQMSVSSDGIGWEEHISWYKNSLGNPNRFLYIGFVNGNEKIGMCRFDVDVEIAIAEVSINLNPRHRGQGFSSQLLSRAIVEFYKERDTDLAAIIKKSNIGSIKCFLRSGFTFEREDNDYNYYKRSAEIIKPTPLNRLGF